MITSQSNPVNSVQRKTTHSLLWKEIWENKLLVVWAVGLTVAFVVGNYTLESINGSHPTYLEPYPVFGVWFIMAALCGSSMVSPEVGNSSLQFLSSLPLSRNRVWWTKLVAQVSLHLVSLIASFGTYWLLICFTLPTMPWRDFATKPIEAVALIAVATIPVVCIAALMTVFTDRTITTFFISAIVCIGIGSMIVGFMSLLLPAHFWIVGVLLAILAVSVLGISRELFVRGETLRTAKRFAILKEISLFDVLPIVMALVLAYLWLMH